VPEPLTWQNSTLNRGDVAVEIPRLKRQPGKDIGIWGSVALVRSLLRLGLLDRLHLQVYPVVLDGQVVLLAYRAAPMPGADRPS
jgi:dihydrofolate reductase